jgi:hypothetical protein
LKYQTAALFDLLPILRYLPDFLAPIKKEGREIHRRELKLFRGLFLNAKTGLQDGTAKVRDPEYLKPRILQ